MKSQVVDIFNEDFFAEDPFGNDNLYYNADFPELSLGLYTVEENIGHSQEYSFDAQSVESESRLFAGSEEKKDDDNDTPKIKDEAHESFLDSVRELDAVLNRRTDDSGTSVTCRSTELESSDPEPYAKYNRFPSLESSWQGSNNTCESYLIDQQGNANEPITPYDYKYEYSLTDQQGNGNAPTIPYGYTYEHSLTDQQGNGNAPETPHDYTCESSLIGPQGNDNKPEASYDYNYKSSIPHQQGNDDEAEASFNYTCESPSIHQHQHQHQQGNNNEPEIPYDYACESCEIYQQTIKEQEQQICFLRRKLQEYADLCSHYNIGQHILINSKGAVHSTGSRTAQTAFEDKTYAELMGPWDIPFHVELIKQNFSQDTAEYSGITFAQHPSKAPRSMQRIPPCPTDDDDALPVTRGFHRKPPRRDNSGSRESFKMEILMDHHRIDELSPEGKTHLSMHLGKVSSQLSSNSGMKVGEGTGQQVTGGSNVHFTKHRNVQCMTVVVERKYGRQKAHYSGTVKDGIPHGVGTLQFLQSGDVYIGEIAYGEMQGKGAYCHAKDNKVFRGIFERNSFVGAGRCK